MYRFIPNQMEKYRNEQYRQSGNYRIIPSDRVPPSFHNRPKVVLQHLVFHREYAKQYDDRDVVPFRDGSNRYRVTRDIHDVKSKHIVDWNKGTCSCTFFKQHKIPCSHKFAVMQCMGLQFESLPSELLESPYMTLDLPSNSNTNTAQRSPSPVPIPTPSEQQQKLDELRKNRAEFHEKRMAKKKNGEIQRKCTLMKNRMIEVNEERMLKLINEGKVDEMAICKKS